MIPSLILRGARTLGIALAASGLVAAMPLFALAATPVPMATNLSYTENFADITNWTNGFAAGIGASRWGGNATAAGTVPAATALTTATTTFVTGTTGGVQRGTGAIVLLATGTTNNTSSAAIDFLMDFTNTTAGNLSFDWAEINNSTGDRAGALKVYSSINGTTWTEISGAAVSVVNNVASNGTVNVALPASFNGSTGARLRFYYYNATGGTTGSRPKLGLDNLTVTASLVTYTLTASAGADGAISPNGITTVNSGASQAYTITPNTNHHVADVLVDGVSQGALTSFTFTNVTANHTISASFAIDTYNISASAGAHGSIAPAGSTAVNATSSQAYTITPNAGYVVQDVLVDAVSVGAVSSYTFTNVLANHTIGASFAPDPTPTVNAGSPGGFVTTVNATASVPVTLTRGTTTPILGFSVDLTLSAGLTTSSGAITEGGFLSADGATTTFQVTDHGGGNFTVDGVTLGVPCGSSATSGTLFTLGVSSTLSGGTGTVTINSVVLRDCSNATLASQVGSAATVDVDRSAPVVAVTSPNGGESWLQGSSHAITWTASDAEGIAANSIVLEYSVDNGSNWLPVASGLANSGTFSWTVPNNPSVTALVRASALDVHANPGSDASDAALTIQGSTSTSLTSAPNPSVTGESVSLTATVSPSVATGSVEFFDGATSLGTASLSGGTASLNTSSLSVGAHSLTAVYAGSALRAGSTSAGHSHTVNPAATSTSLASAPNPSVAGESVALTASVAANSPGAGSPGGSVAFFDGETSLGTATLSAGSAVLNTSSLSVGPHSLTAVYSGDVSFSGSPSTVHSHTVNPAATTTSVSSAANPSVTGESVAITASVAANSPGAGGPAGSVEFFDGATSLGTATLSGGSAALNTSSLAVGSHSLTAVYSGDVSFAGSTSAAHTHTVSQASTTTSLTSAPNPSAFGESTTLTASVAANSPGAGGPAGSVEFFDGATSLGTSPLVAGSAALSTAALAVGSHSLTAVYAGDPSFTGSTSATHTHTVNAAATTTALSTTPNPSVAGESVALNATVAPPAATGSVEFFDGAASLGTSPVSAGAASLSTSSLSVGTHSLTAVYSGDGSFSGSPSTAHSHTVNQAATTTSVSSAPNPSVTGQSVAITASVAANSPGAGGPGGSVEFFDGATSLGTASLSGGSAALNTSSLAVGSHSLTAVYSGDVSFAGSTSAAHTHTVNQASTTTSLTSAPNPTLFGGSTTLTASVAANSPGAGGPAGSVEFFDGATSLGTSPLVAGSAALSTAALAVGSHSLTAVYSGDASFTGSTSTAQTHTVNSAATTTTVTSSPNPSVVGETVALTASVSPAAATGTVEFFEGATSLGTATLSGGSATLNLASFSAGTHSVTAVYAGDLTYITSTSAAHIHAVNPASTATSLTSTPNPSTLGQSVALNATVTVNPPGAGVPGGSVQFFDGATSLGSSPPVAGAATLSTSSLSVGAHNLTAIYSGDASFSGSTSAVHAHTVNQGATTTSVVSSLNPSSFGASVDFTATVAPSGATGSVEFFDGATSLGTSTLSAGSAALSTSALAAGSHSITAVYSGNSSYAGSTSTVLTQVVNAASSTVSLLAAPSPGVYQDPETLTATVAGTGTPGGSVEFFDGATSLGTSPVLGGTAVLITSSLTVGVRSLTASYGGDANHSPASSSAVSLEIRAKVVATAGPNGSIVPAGTLLVSLGATPSFTFAAVAGYHVASVTVDGGAAALTSPYTFAAVSSNHTIDVQFAVNPAVAAISTLAATQLHTGNDGDGNTKITLTWTPTPGGTTVQVWRKGFGNYPEYDDGPTPGETPPVPGAYPPAGWTLTAVASPGDTDEPGSRDFWYYVAYVQDAFGTRSPVSNRTGGTLDYHLGDVSNGITLGAGDNHVTLTDVSLLGAHYGISGAAVDPFNYLDVGPTTDLSVNSRPTTDNRVNFEDLVLFAINFFPVASAPQAQARPAAAATDAITMSAPTHVAPGQDIQDIAVRLLFSGTGRMLAVSARLAWDPAVVQPVSYTAGDAVLAQGGLVFSAEPGLLDGASFAGAGQGIVGDGEFATVHFRVVAPGEPKFGFAQVDARDAQNQSLHVDSGVLAVAPRTWVTAFAPAMPNPFGRSTTTTFQFSLSKPGRADLEVFSVDGRHVRTLSSGVREAGEYRLEWNGSDDSGRPLAAGVYYARFVTAQGRFTRVVTYLR